MDYKVGDFTFIKDPMFQKAVENAYIHVNETNLWEFFKTYTPDEDKGYMYSRNATLDKISLALSSDGHSGASFAITMRNMQLIALRGWDGYVKTYLKASE